MRSYYKIVLVKSKSEEQEISFYTSLTMANKVFNALSFALNGGDYRQILLSVGRAHPQIINQARLHWGAKDGF